MQLCNFTILNPKQNGHSSSGRAGWYPYYAGYCSLFVNQIIRQSLTDGTKTVLDPWNGAGTTSQVAFDLGHNCLGFDLNPAMTLVARARLIQPGALENLAGTLLELSRLARSYRKVEYFDDDPLGNWFCRPSITAIRHIDRALRHVTEASDSFELGPQHFDQMSVTTCFYYTALCRVLRTITRRFRASNPTWLKPTTTYRNRLRPTLDTLLEELEVQCVQMLHLYQSDEFLNAPNIHQSNVCQISTASSRSLPVSDEIADLVISSPPYCTRIDYAKSTAVELALLGVGRNGTFRSLRDEMIGTSTIKSELPKRSSSWGKTCNSLIDAVLSHYSKASKSYYSKTLMQYFDGMCESLAEIDRCLKSQGTCVLVVQDSYYKDVRVDLPTIIEEMAVNLKWSLTTRSDFRVNRTMLAVNSRSRKYRKDSGSIESVLWFHK